MKPDYFGSFGGERRYSISIEEMHAIADILCGIKKLELTQNVFGEEVVLEEIKKAAKKFHDAEKRDSAAFLEKYIDKEINNG